VWEHYSISPLRDTRGRVKSVIGMVIDITERRAAAEELRAAGIRREATLSAAEIGSWVYDMHTRAVTNDANFAHIHPDDLGTIMAAIDTIDRGRACCRLSNFRAHAQIALLQADMTHAPIATRVPLPSIER
jgi:PAS domain-containing protein